MLFDERGSLSAAANCLEPQGPGAGEQIECMSSLDIGPKQIENRLAKAVFHRPSA